MADLSQITLLPAIQVQGPSQSAQGTTSQANAILNAQPTGSLLQGFIINRDPSGNPIVRTDKGDIPFTSNFFLKIGSEVVIRVGNSAGNAIANLISVDGYSPEEAQKISAFSQDQDVILSPQLKSQASATAANAQTKEAGFTVSGTIVSQPKTDTPDAPPLPNGTQITLKIVSYTSPATAQLPLQNAATAPDEPNAPATSSFYATYARASAVATPPSPLNPANPAQAPTTQATLPTVASNVTTAPLTPAIPANQAAAPSALVATPVITASTVTPAAQSGLPPAVTTATPPQTATPPLTTQAANTPVTTPAPPQPQPSLIPSAAPTILASPPVAQPAVSVNTTLTPTVYNAATQQAPQTQAVLSATVIGVESSGEPLIQSPIGLIRLQASPPIQAGSQITFEVVQTELASRQATTVLSSNTQPAPIKELAQQWTSIQQIFALLSGRSTLTELDDLLATNSPANASAAPNTQPNTLSGQSISSALLVFLSAVRRNDFNNWLGYSNVRHLQSQGHEELLTKAQAEFSSLAAQFTQSTPDQWQPLFFPIAADGMLQQVRLYVKRDRKQDGGQNDKNKEEDTRFVIEVDLTQLGELQMDGFIRKQDNNLQFDMIIRSLSGLSKEIQEDILRIYNDMGAITGYKGSIAFQAVREFPVNPMQDIAASGDDVFV